MSLLGLFGVGPLSEAKIDKVAKLAANPFAQPDVRMKEMGRLLNEGTPAALRGVLKRFSANAQGHIADEDEKKWLEDKLTEVGEDALEPLAEYIASEDKLTYALRSYHRIAGATRSLELFTKTLEKYGPDNYRAGEAKLQLIWQLAEYLDDPKVIATLAPFLLDHSDDVRWIVLELIERASKENQLSEETRQVAAEHLAQLLGSQDTSPRILKRTAELCVDREWSVPGTFEHLALGIEPEFFLDKKRYVRRRSKKVDT